MKKTPYTIPKISDKGNDWFIWFRYNGTLVKKRYDLNRIKDLKKRQFEADVFRLALETTLKNGWNPFDNEPAKTKSLTIIEALDFAFDKKKSNLRPKTLADYRCTLRFVKTAVIALKMENLSITDTKRVHIKSIMQEMKKERGWSNNAYNKHLGHIQAILSELLEWDIIETNPAHKIKKLEVLETNANRPPTPEEHELIKNHLIQQHFNFFRFISTLFDTGIRPYEITNIQISMIDTSERLFILPAEITKTKRLRIVPINPHLWELVEPLLSCPGNYYLFGSFRQSGKGNVGGKEDFIPGPTQLSRDTATKRWNKIVKKGLGIDVNMYAMKHFGADMKILAGIDLSALRELYGHTSTRMTERYAKAVHQVYRKQIVEMSPKF